MSFIVDLFRKYREIVLYLICGAATVLVSFASYALFVWIGIDPNISNILSWICAVSFAFIVNKWFVFLSHSMVKEVLVKEIGSFFFLRIMTGLVRMGVFPILYSYFGIDDFAALVIVTILEIVLNYIASKFIVFRRKKETA